MYCTFIHLVKNDYFRLVCIPAIQLKAPQLFFVDPLLTTELGKVADNYK